MRFLKPLLISTACVAYAVVGKAQDFTSDPIALGLDSASVKTMPMDQGKKIVKTANLVRGSAATKNEIFVSFEQNFTEGVHTASMVSATRKDFGHTISAYKENPNNPKYRLIEFADREEGGRYVTLRDTFVTKGYADTAIMTALNNYKNDPDQMVKETKKRSKEKARQERTTKPDADDNAVRMSKRPAPQANIYGRKKRVPLLMICG